MTTAATIAAELILDSSGFEKGMKGAQRSIDSFDKKMKDLGQRMTKVGATMTLSMTVPIVAFGKAAVDAAIESENAMAELDAVLKSTGNIAGLTADEISKMADDLQKRTMFTDEQIMQGQSMLLTFTKIGKDVFPDATMAMLNMAQKFGSVEEASIQLGKALNDPVQGVTALRRVGVMLSAEQEAQIKKFMDVGDVASAQRVILEELGTEFGGLAEAMSKTTAGQFDQFNKSLDHMKETLGAALIPALVRFMDALTPIIEAIADAPPWVQDLIVVFLGLVALAGPLTSFFGMVSSFIGWVSGLGLTFTGLGTAIAGVGTFISATLLPAIVALLPVLALIAAAALLVYMVWSNWDTLKTTLEQLWFIIKFGFQQVITAIVTGFQNGMKAIQAKVKPVADFLKKTWSNIKLAFSTAFMGIMSIAMKVFNGIRNAIMVVVNAIAKVKAAFAGIKLPAALTPGSPTPFEMGLRGINKQMGILSGQSMPQMQTGFANLAPAGVTDVGGNGGYGTYNDNRRFAAGVSPEAVKMALDDRTKQMTRALDRSR